VKWRIACAIVIIVTVVAFAFWPRGRAQTSHFEQPQTTPSAPTGDPSQNAPIPQVKNPIVFIPPPWPNGESPKAPNVRNPMVDTSDAEEGVVRVEDSGPDITGTPPDVLLASIQTGASTDKTAKRAAWELGNRAISKGWVPTKDQAAVLLHVVETLVDDRKLGDSDFYSNSRDQLYRLWSLAHPGLIQSLEPQRKHRDLIVKSLAATRTKSLVEELLTQYRIESDPHRKMLLAFTLSCMKEQRTLGIPRRSVMGTGESAALYSIINSTIQTTK
jgi:hypothetical protein